MQLWARVRPRYDTYSLDGNYTIHFLISQFKLMQLQSYPPKLGNMHELRTQQNNYKELH